jgi:hypothetical protein
MQAGDLVQANQFANWSARQAKIGLVLESFVKPDGGFPGYPVTLLRLILGGVVKVLPANHFEVVHEGR